MLIRHSILLGYFGLGYVFKNSKFELKITKYNKLVALCF